MAENALLKSDESGMLGFMKWTNQKLDEIQKWKSIQSRINSISLLKYNDIAGAVTTEVNYFKEIDQLLAPFFVSESL